ncbi:MAG: M56 family metallopeptidase, partial [Leeuwenhoekiella sp.]
MATYLFQVILFQAIFLVVYKLWLQKETFFNANRIYLLFTPILALFIPFFEVEILKQTVNVPNIISELPAVFIGNATPEPVITSAETTNPDFSIKWVVFWVYLAGFLFSSFLFYRKFSALSRFFRFKHNTDSHIITIPNSDAAFTFLGSIFLGEKLDTLSRKQILEHEQVHLDQKHSLDLLFFEFLRVVFWFNPLVYLYQKALSELHEFIADHKASAKTESKTYYNQLLNKAFGTEKISFINTFFNQSLIKKRIVMLQKQSTSKAGLKYFILIPLFVGMITYVSCTSDSEPVKNENTTLDQQLAELEISLDNIDSLTDSQLENLKKVLADAAKKKRIVQIT